jgi:hypothetical protein
MNATDLKRFKDWITPENINERLCGLTLLHWTIRRRLSDRMQILIEQKADVNAQDEQGRTPLIYAIERFNRPLMDMLLNAGANPNISKPDGTTVFGTLLQFRTQQLTPDQTNTKVEMFQRLLAKGADPWLGSVKSISNLEVHRMNYRLSSVMDTLEPTDELLIITVMEKKQSLHLLAHGSGSVVQRAQKRPLFERFLLRLLLQYSTQTLGKSKKRELYSE